jgi:hypothetical protein
VGGAHKFLFVLLYCIQEKEYILGRICLTSFVDYLGADCIRPTADLRACTVNDLLDYNPLTGYIAGNQRLL